MKKLHIVLKNGCVIQQEIMPEGFQFGVLVRSIRSDGFYLSPEVYIPAENINAVLFGDGSTASPMSDAMKGLTQ